ncbi:MAG: hypothetical protein ACK5CE_04850 [Actinomycetes bacterium]
MSDAAEHDGTAGAERRLEKVRIFVTETLDDRERAMFAVLLAPGVAAAYATDDRPDVAGFALDDAHWQPLPLPQTLASVVRSAEVRIVVEPRWARQEPTEGL